MSVCTMDTGAALIPYPRTRAVGREAEEVQRQEIGIEREILAVPGFGSKLESLVMAILSAVAERRVPDWDGHGAAVASIPSARYAIGLLKPLLLIAPDPPDIYVDPDGEVALEWHHGPRRVFSVSVGPRGELTYAGLFGRNKTHGVEAHVAGGLPRTIRAGIRRVYAEW